MNLQAVSSGVSCRVVSETDEGWAQARLAWNRAADQRPRLVAFPNTAAEVVEIAGLARELGLRLAPQATGHGAGALAALEEAILVNVSGLAGVEIDPGQGGPESGPAFSGERSRLPPPSTAWPAWPVPRRTSERRVTAWAAVSAGWAGGTAWPATASSPRTL